MYDLTLEMDMTDATKQHQKWKQNSFQVAKAAVNKFSSFWPKSFIPGPANHSTKSITERHRLPAATAAEQLHQLPRSRNFDEEECFSFYGKVNVKGDWVDVKGEDFQLLPINKENLPLFRKLNIALFPVIYQETFYQNVLYRYPSFLSRIAYHKGKAIGAISCRKEYVDGCNRVYIMTIGILDSYRRFGLGSLLLSRILSACEKDDIIEHVCLHVHVLNAAALSFYRKHGFKIETKVYNYYERNIVEPPDAYLLKKARNESI